MFINVFVHVHMYTGISVCIYTQIPYACMHTHILKKSSVYEYAHLVICINMHLMRRSRKS
jgi:hypothetical protein